MARGKLITIEGLDGAGKTTLARDLLDAVRARGIDAQLLREPGGVRVAELIRDLVMDPELEIGARTEALLYAAARAQLVDEALEPLLARGTVVLLDRFVDSSLAYQGGGRRLGIDRVGIVNQFATAGIEPDRTLLLSVDRRTGRERLGGRADAPDRLELESDGFFERTAAAYRDLAERDAKRIVTIDATAPPEEVLTAALAAIADLL